MNPITETLNKIQERVGMADTLAGIILERYCMTEGEPGLDVQETFAITAMIGEVLQQADKMINDAFGQLKEPTLAVANQGGET
jgi:hypothetical protein